MRLFAAALALLGLFSIGAYASEPQIQSVLNYDHAQCDSTVLQLLQLVELYREKAVMSSRSAEGDLKKVHSFLFTDIGYSHPCFRAAADAYVLESLIVTEPDPIVFPILQDKSPEDHATFQLTASLINSGRIELLTPALRQTLGEGWNDPFKQQGKFDSPYQLRAAYSCVESKIYLDPEMSPFNLAANLEHELDHFVRDRRSPAPQAGDSWKSILLEDEVLALSTGIFPEVFLSSKYLPHSKADKILGAIGGQGPGLFQHPYQVKDDDNLFAKNGPFSELFQYGCTMQTDLFGFILTTVLTSGTGDYMYANDVDKIYQAVNAVYFPSSALAPDLLQSTLRANWQQPPQGLYRWLREDVINLGANAALSELLTGLDQPSPQCQALVASHDNPDVKAYIGSRLPIAAESVSAPGESGVKGGEGGVKGGEGGVKGGESGVKGGESGVKGGEGGVKGSAPVRACLMLAPIK